MEVEKSEGPSFWDRIFNPYKDKNAKVILSKVLLSQRQIDDLKYKGECFAPDEQQEFLKQFDDKEK